MQETRRKIRRQFLLFLICFSVLCAAPGRVLAAGRTLTLSAVKSMALANSSEYTLLCNKITLAKAQYDQAVKSLKLKERNQRTLRWSPLLSFKLPEKPDLSDQSEYVYKPLELQSQIDKLQHELGDCVYAVYEKAGLSFIGLYTLQERIRFLREQIGNCQNTLSKSRAKMLLGQADKADVEAMEKKLETLADALAADQRKMEAEREKLSEMIGMELTALYSFANPFQDAALGRDDLEELITYTVEHDDSFYKAKTDTANALLALNVNYDLMRSHYGDDMDLISSFINQAKGGGRLDAAAFKLRYNELLDRVDRPWQGHFRILFIKIPKEWIKGAVDGIRYVEDEPYALYEAALEYQNLYEEEQMAKRQLTAQVKEYYENYISLKNACQSLQKEIERKREELAVAAALNRIGEISFAEYQDVEEAYEALQMDRLETTASYNEQLCSFDRLTCGAVSRYLSGAAVSMTAAAGGESYVVKDEGEGVYYYIHPLVSGNLFEFGLSVPEDFGVTISSYELWVEGVMVGGRTACESPVLHLALDIERADSAFVRLYDGDTFLDDCPFDPAVYSGRLTVAADYRIETKEDTLVAAYTAETLNAGMVVVTIHPQAAEEIAFYNIKTKTGEYLVSEEKRDIREGFRYLAIAENSLEELIVCFYDKENTFLYEGMFHTDEQTIHRALQ